MTPRLHTTAKDLWDEGIRRSEQLAVQNEAVRELLTFYGRLLRAQQQIYEHVRSRIGWLPSGNLQDDLPVVRAALPVLLETIESSGPQALVAEARNLSEAPEEELDELLLAQWRQPSELQFFAKAFLQPYARWLADSDGRPVDRALEVGVNYCPFCAGRPQCSILKTTGEEAEGGGRELLCSTCLTVWPVRRVLCINCGEEHPAKLAYFHSPEFDHVRVEACDNCRRYIKGIDLTRLGLAVPLVDEVATAPLDLWACEHGYKKVELNLVGF
jgi:formate dehydrogenase accessory protein FdhE